MVLVLIDHNISVLELKKIVSELYSIDMRSWKVILLNYRLKEELQGEDIPCSFIDDYFFEEDHCYDYSQAIKISDQWFLDSNGNDATIYREISIGVILQATISRILNDFLSSVKTAEEVLKKENPDEIWLCFSKSGKDLGLINDSSIFMKLFSDLAKNKNISCKEIILNEKPQKIKLTRVTKVFLHRCKLLSYSLIICRMLFFAKWYLLMRKKRNVVNIILPSPQALNYMGRTVLDEILVNKERNVLIWRGETARQRVNLIDILPSFFYMMKNSCTEINSKVERKFSDFIENTKVEEIKKAYNLIKEIYKQQIKPLVRGIISDIERLESCFSKIDIHLVFSHADTTIKERTVISVANKYKVPSLVLQHGNAGHYWGFFPLIATKFAAWGEITEKWFVRNGVSKDRICITGAANFDSYVRTNENYERDVESYWNGEKDYILYVTGVGRNLTTGIKFTKQDYEYLLNIILDTIEMMPEKILVIKLRPGDPQADFYKSEIKRRRLKSVYLIEVTNNGRLLNACGVLLTISSTMAVEALFFEKPIIQLKFIISKRGSLRKNLYSQGIICDEDGISLARYGAALGVEKPEELREAIVRIYEDENLRKSVIDKGKVFLRKYAYEPDGKASLRVLKCIDELIREVS